MLLVMNIGNTHISLGLFKNKERIGDWRLSTDQNKTEDDYGLQICSLTEQKQAKVEEGIDGIIISSVVPPIVPVMERMCQKYFQQTAFIVGPGMKTGLNIRYDNPREVGADRIVNAVAAIKEYNGPMIIADFGTAATFCYIDDANRYIGGAIAPGLTISADALYENGSKLPRVELDQPAQIIGRNTIHAMQSGIYYGYAGQVDGIVSRIKEEVGGNPFVLATGGDATLISKASHVIDKVDPYLTLKGLCYIYDKNIS
ncbi:type III pantothenate kinase [Salibacterium salarium]|uniref:type III pantothenate kinase n=1 Tax=Salibacterium salarium TaxID=284579 RepID=UPI00278163AE|nr:type III pantothenate kinase [Salibacterium salarium]MDQ0300978.1 type III pantothenate kinase [Salibacterium salarium]